MDSSKKYDILKESKHIHSDHKGGISMLKKILTLLLTCTLAAGIAGCGKTEEPPVKEPSISELIPTAEEAVASMVAPIDALARCMLENDLAYDANDPEFIWTALFYFAGEHASEDAAVTKTDKGYLNVPTEVMLEHAKTLFHNLTALPELPPIMHGNITYDAAADAYLLAQGDHGLSEMILADAKETEGGYTVTAQLWSMDESSEIIAEWDTTLQKLTFEEHTTLPRYLCSISDMVQIEAAEETPSAPENIPAPPAQPKGELATAVFNGLSDSHTAEVTLPDGSFAALQFDANSPVAAEITSLSEGDGFTFRYTTDSSTGAMKLLAIE